jgi:hypothetical protein
MDGGVIGEGDQNDPFFKSQNININCPFLKHLEISCVSFSFDTLQKIMDHSLYLKSASFTHSKFRIGGFVQDTLKSDVSSNKTLEPNTVRLKHPRLRRLDLSYNYFSSLDLKMPKLNTLILRNCSCFDDQGLHSLLYGYPFPIIQTFNGIGFEERLSFENQVSGIKENPDEADVIPMDGTQNDSALPLSSDLSKHSNLRFIPVMLPFLQSLYLSFNPLLINPVIMLPSLITLSFTSCSYLSSAVIYTPVLVSLSLTNCVVFASIFLYSKALVNVGLPRMPILKNMEDEVITEVGGRVSKIKSNPLIGVGVNDVIFVDKVESKVLPSDNLTHYIDSLYPSDDEELKADNNNNKNSGVPSLGTVVIPNVLFCPNLRTVVIEEPPSASLEIGYQREGSNVSSSGGKSV